MPRDPPSVTQMETVTKEAHCLWLHWKPMVLGSCLVALTLLLNALMRADCISRRYLVQEGHHCKILQENSEPGE